MRITPFADEPLTQGGVFVDACRLPCLSAQTMAEVSFQDRILFVYGCCGCCCCLTADQGTS